MNTPLNMNEITESKPITITGQKGHKLMRQDTRHSKSGRLIVWDNLFLFTLMTNYLEARLIN